MTVVTRVSSRRPPRSRRRRQDGHDLVAVDLAAQVVDGQARSASPSCAMPASAPCVRRPPQRPQVRGAVPVVDVAARRLGTDHHDVGAGVAQAAGGGDAGRAVSAVDDDAQAVEPVAAAW
jgi:hypothetical protein